MKNAPIGVHRELSLGREEPAGGPLLGLRSTAGSVRQETKTITPLWFLATEIWLPGRPQGKRAAAARRWDRRTSIVAMNQRRRGGGSVAEGMGMGYYRW